MSTLSVIADLFSIIAGLMTILGIGGLVSWSIFSKHRGKFSENVMSVFAYSMKTAICFILLGPASMAWGLIYFGMILFIKGYVGPAKPYYWDPSDPLPHLAGYAVSFMIVLPLYLLLCASIYKWSLSPFVQFLKKFEYKKDVPTKDSSGEALPRTDSDGDVSGGEKAHRGEKL